MSLSPETRERIVSLVESHPVFLFMKGTPEAPQCGFSAQVVKLLGRLLPTYGTCDVLQDPLVREGIKEFSDWPTIPQLYINGEFMGGCDIITEQYASGELRRALGLPSPVTSPPNLTITESAAELLRGALARAEDTALHLSIDARFQSSLGFGPVEPGELAVECGHLTLLVDPDTAARADGVTIDTVDTDEGHWLKVDNPNAPKARPLSVHELKRLRDTGQAHELFDVRTPEEREKAKIEGSRLADDEARAYIESLDRDALLVFHCHHGGRGQAAAEHFAGLGFRNVHNLTGGIDAWSAEIDPSVPRY